MIPITHISARPILDSRQRPTLRVYAFSGEHEASADVPSGASTGEWEACELRDPDGGVATAINNVETLIRDALLGKDCTNQKNIDEILIALDGTTKKTKLGGNALIGVSIACAKLSARAHNLSLFRYINEISNLDVEPMAPRLYVNVVNGGKHAQTPLAFQEYHIVPTTRRVSVAIEQAVIIQRALGELFSSNYDTVSIGDEGGFVISEPDVHRPLEFIQEVISTHKLDGLVQLSLDIAASSFYDTKSNSYTTGGGVYSQEGYYELIDRISHISELFSIEDPFHEEDFVSHADLRLERNTRIIGDDLTVTNEKRLARALEIGAVDGLIIKPNQIGTLSETFATMRLAYDHDIECIASHRSGETMDSFIADFAYATACSGIKAGAFGPAERQVKYDRLTTIDHEYRTP